MRKNNIKVFMAALIFAAMGLFLNIPTAIAEEQSNVESGIYEVENDVYHDSEIGMSMARSYLNPTMEVEVLKNKITYTIGFSGTEYMENFRIKLNDKETNIDIVSEDTENHTIKLKVDVDKLNADMKALIYVDPMGRDVEFKVIPKLDTLKLIKKIEEPEEKKEEVSKVSTETSEENKGDNLEKLEGNKKTSKGTLVAVVGGGVILLGGIIVLLNKKGKK